jgi:hypothetical protein
LRSWCIVFGLLCWLLGVKGRADAPILLTQRKINAMAAKIENALSAILEVPKLRRPNEPLPDYCRRLTDRIHGEVTADHKKRLIGYTESLAQALPREIAGSSRLGLADQSAANQARWGRLTRTFGYLPGRLKKLRAVIAEGKPAAGELEQTLALLTSARNELRDARP